MFQRAIMEVCEQICSGPLLVGCLCVCLVCLWTKACYCLLSSLLHGHEHANLHNIAANKLDSGKDPNWPVEIYQINLDWFLNTADQGHFQYNIRITVGA